MFEFLRLGAAAAAAAKSLYCVKSPHPKASCQVIQESSTALQGLPLVELEPGTPTTDTVDSTSFLVFNGDVTVNKEFYEPFKALGTQQQFAYNCKVIIQLGDNYPLTTNLLPTCFSYEGSITLTNTDTIDPATLKGYGIPITLGGDLTLNLDSCLNSLPNMDKITQSTHKITFNLDSKNSLKTVYLEMKGDTVTWGKTTITLKPNYQFKGKNVIITTNKIKPTPANVPTLLSPFYFDDTFKGLPDLYAYSTDSLVQYVPDTGSPAYVTIPATGGGAHVLALTYTQLKVFCVGLEASKGTACQSYKDHFDVATNFQKHDATVTVAATTSDLVILDGTMTLTNTIWAQYKVGILLLDDAKGISLDQPAAANVPQKLDVRRPIWKFLNPAAASLLTTALPFDGEFNPQINLDSTGATFTTTKMAITSDNSGTYDSVADSTDKAVKIATFFESTTKVTIENGQIIIGGATIKAVKSSALTSVELTSSPGTKIEVSQNNANTELPITLTALDAEISFDSTWNNMDKPFVTTSSGSISVATDGPPKWLNPQSIGQGTIKVNAQTPPAPKSDGLPSWGIALIVIACVIVVAVIAVVVLNMTGVIHLCGKKKVEV